MLNKSLTRNKEKTISMIFVSAVFATDVPSPDGKKLWRILMSFLNPFSNQRDRFHIMQKDVQDLNLLEQSYLMYSQVYFPNNSWNC